MNNHPWYWSAEEHERWRGTREEGKKHFVIRYSIPWGILMFTVFVFLPVLPGNPFAEDITIKHVLIQLVVWPAGAYMYGLTSWWWCERWFWKFEKPDRSATDA